MRIPNYSPLKAVEIQKKVIAALSSYSGDRHFYNARLLGQMADVPEKHIPFLMAPYVFDEKTNPNGQLEARNGVGISYRFRQLPQTPA